MDACVRFTIASILANLISLEMNPKWHWRTPMRSMNELMFKLPLSLSTQCSARWQKFYYCAINAILRPPRLQKRIEPASEANPSVYTRDFHCSKLQTCILWSDYPKSRKVCDPGIPAMSLYCLPKSRLLGSTLWGKLIVSARPVAGIGWGDGGL